MKCNKCQLYKNSDKPCIQGVGSSKAKLMVIGMNPALEEDEQGIPFIGKAGQELNKALRIAGINREDIFITNLTKCRTPNNREPTKEETEACMPYLIEEIKRIQPNTILLLGNYVSGYLIGKKGIQRHHGKILWNDKLKVKMVITTHPASICYGDPRAATMLVNDLRIAYNDSLLKGFHSAKRKVQYKVCKTMVEVYKLFDYLKKKKEFVIDLETTLLNPLEKEAEILCIGFSGKETTAIVLPIWEWNRGLVWSEEDYETIKYKLKEILENENLGKILANGKFDIGWLKAKYNINLMGFIFDTEIAHYLIHNIERRHGMDVLSYRYTDMGGYKDKLDKDKEEGFRHTKPEDIYEYCAMDCDCEFRVKNVLAKEIGPYKELMTNILLPLSTVLADMELTGVRLDMTKINILIDKIEPQVKTLANKMSKFTAVSNFIRQRNKEREDKLTEKYNKSKTLSKRYKSLKEYIEKRKILFKINFKSPKQLATILYEEPYLNIQNTTKTKKGKQKSTDSKTLKLLKGKHQIFGLLLEYRRLTKLLSTYLLPMEELTKLDGRLHTQFQQTRTATMRLSSKKPNLQNIPKKEAKDIRDCFIPSKGNVLIDADLKAIEWRWLAHFSQDKQMIEDIISGKDIHRYLGSKVFSKSEEDVTKLERDNIKSITYGSPYGRGASAIAKQFELHIDEVNQVTEELYKRYSTLRKWLDAVKERIHKYKYVKTFFGFKRDISKIDDENEYIQAEAEREAIASCIQGSAAGLIFIYTNNIYRGLKQKGLKTKMLLQVHDNLVFDTPKNEVQKIVKIIQEEMTKSIEGLRIPIQVEIAVGDSWGNLKEVK